MKNLTKIFALILVISTLFLLASCGAGDAEETVKSGDDSTAPDTITLPVTDAPETDPPAKTIFTVNVKDGEGNAVKGVMVQVCTDTMCYSATSDDNGVAVFTEDQFASVDSGYTFAVAYAPDGYTHENMGDNKLYLEAGSTVLDIVLEKAE